MGGRGEGVRGGHFARRPLSPRSRRAASWPSLQSKERSKTPPAVGPARGRPRPATARARRAGRAGQSAREASAASGSSEPITARTPVDCHQGPVSTQWASTARTFHSRPRHRNCSGPSPTWPGPATQPLRTSTGSSYRLTRCLSPAPVDPCATGPAGAGVEVAPPDLIEQVFEQVHGTPRPRQGVKSEPAAGGQSGPGISGVRRGELGAAEELAGVAVARGSRRAPGRAGRRPPPGRRRATGGSAGRTASIANRNEPGEHGQRDPRAAVALAEEHHEHPGQQGVDDEEDHGHRDERGRVDPGRGGGPTQDRTRSSRRTTVSSVVTAADPDQRQLGPDRVGHRSRPLPPHPDPLLTRGPIGST